jgi:hypothetical protein
MGVFDTINFTTDEGAKLKRLLNDRLSELSAQLESPTMMERETFITRGAIAEIKRLLNVAPPHVAPLRYSGQYKPDGGNL